RPLPRELFPRRLDWQRWTRTGLRDLRMAGDCRGNRNCSAARGCLSRARCAATVVKIRQAGLSEAIPYVGYRRSCGNSGDDVEFPYRVRGFLEQQGGDTTALPLAADSRGTNPDGLPALPPHDE